MFFYSIIRLKDGNITRKNITDFLLTNQDSVKKNFNHMWWLVRESNPNLHYSYFPEASSKFLK